MRRNRDVGDASGAGDGFPGNGLERGLVEAAEGRREVTSWVQDLVRSTVWVPLGGADGASGSFPVLSIDGGSYVPAFTSEAQLEKVAGTGSRVNPPVEELVAALPDSVGLAVNPGGTVGLPLPAALLRQMLGLGSTLAAGTTLRIGEPADEPTELLRALATELGRVPAVREARRAWAAVGESAPGLVVGIDLDPDNDDTRSGVLEAVRSAAGTSPVEFPVDVVFGNDRDALTEWMSSNTDPFYVA